MDADPKYGNIIIRDTVAGFCRYNKDIKTYLDGQCIQKKPKDAQSNNDMHIIDMYYIYIKYMSIYIYTYTYKYTCI